MFIVQTATYFYFIICNFYFVSLLTTDTSIIHCLRFRHGSCRNGRVASNNTIG